MSALTCYIPDHITEASEYVLSIIEKRFDIKFSIKVHAKSIYTFKYGNSALIFPSSFVSTEKNRWLKKRSKFNFKIKKTSFDGNNYYHIAPFKKTDHLHGDDYSLNIDLIGTIFIMLSRYEEYVLSKPHFDTFGRFKAESSVNYSALHIPIVDELLYLFSYLLRSRLNFPLREKNSNFAILPTHDVDRPFEYLYYSPFRISKRLLGDLILRRSISQVKKRWKKYRTVKKGNWDQDPYNTFEWIMDASEKEGLSSSFHFIPQATVPEKDQKYDLKNIEIKKLLLNINRRGHSIELHPSFGASLMHGQLSKEAEILREVCNELGISIEHLKSRYHYLRWNNNSLEELENANIQIDQTLGYATQPGFRCGTCHPYRAFNFQKMSASSVIIEPLILMDVSLFSDTYLGLADDFGKAWKIVEQLKNQCKKHKGNFTILWHNNQLVYEKMKTFYQQCISL